MAVDKIILKKIIVGTPVKRVTSGAFSIDNLSGVNTDTTESDGSILAYRPSTDDYEVTALRGSSNITVNYDSTNLSYNFGFTGGEFTGSLVPDSNEVYDLGTASKKWRDLYLSGQTINLGTLQLKDSGGKFVSINDDGVKQALQISLVTNNSGILAFNPQTGVATFNDSDIARTDINDTFHQGVTVLNGATIDSATIVNLASSNFTGSQATFDSVNIGELRVLGNTVLDGNLTITGTETTVNTETINLADNTIVLNSNATGTPTENGGIEVERGDLANVDFLWDEGDQQWTLGDKNLATSGKILYGNVYDSEGALPSASAYHGMYAHVHNNGRGYVSHAGNWHKLIDSDTTTLQQVYNLTSNNASIVTANVTTGNITDIVNTNLTGSQATFDSATIQTLQFTNLTNTTSDITEGGNLYYTRARFDSALGDTTSIASIRSYFAASGDLTYNSSTGTFSFDVEDVYTKANFDSDLGDALVGGTGISYDSSSDTISITNTGVAAATYGSASHIPVFTVNAQGQLDSAGTVAVAGVTAFAFDSSNGNLTIGTADGASFVTTATLDPFSTTNLAEGNKLYYTRARFDSALGDATSTSTVRGMLSAGGDLSYNSSTGQFSFDVEQVYTKTNFDSDLGDAIAGGQGITFDSGGDVISITNTGVAAATYGSSTAIPVFTVNAQGQLDSAGTVSVASISSFAFDSSDGDIVIGTTDGSTFTTRINLSPFSTSTLDEGTKLYYTTSRADSDFDIRLATKTTTHVAEGNNLYYTTARWDAQLATKDLDNISEGSANLYYTTARADSDAKASLLVANASGDGSLAYDSATGVFTYTGPSASEARAHFSAGGDMTYDSSTGRFSIDVEQVYTKANFDSDFLSRLVTQIDSAAITTLLSTNATITNAGIDSATITSLANTNFTGSQATIDSANIGTLKFTTLTNTTSDITEGNRLYYTDARARNSIGISDVGGDGSLAYDSGTGRFTYTGPSATEVRAHLTANKGLSVTSGGQFNIDSANVKGMFSVTDAGGDGSLSYSNGVITYTGPSATEVRAHLSAGTGVTYSGGAISIGQAVATTSNVQFNNIDVDGFVDLGNTNGNPAYTKGRMFYDSDAEALSYYPTSANDVTVNMGQEFIVKVKNVSGAQINNGSAVYISGADSEGHPTVSLARANSATTYKAIGLATHNIVNNAHGFITQLGFVNDMNTAGFTEGATLYVSPDSAGKITTTKPTGSDFPFTIGWVIKGDSAGAGGKTLVRPSSETFDNVRSTLDIVADRKITADSAEFNLVQMSNSEYTAAVVPTLREGNLFYMNGPDALAYQNADVTIKLSQDDVTRVYNNSGTSIAKGKSVYVSGASSDFPTIALARSNAFSTVQNTLGLTAHVIANGAFGFVTTRGLFGGLNTAAYSAGNRVHVSPDSAGELVTANPVFPNYAFEIGTVLVADSAGAGGGVGGCIQIDLKSEVFETVRVDGVSRFDGNVTIAGNLNILGSESKTSVATLAVGDQFISVQEGDTITTALRAGDSGVNNVLFKDHYKGDDTQTYFVQIYDADSAAAGDVIRWGLDSANGGPGIGAFKHIGFDSAGGDSDWNLKTDGLTNIPLRFNITLDVGTDNGHDSGDVWKGAAAPLNEDFGFFGNYNTGSQPFTHAGMFYDASATKFKFFDRYDLDIAGNVNTSGGNFALGDVEAASFTGALTGAVTGNASTATLLQNARTIAINGDVTGTATSFNGGADISIAAAITAGSIINADIKSDAAIVDTKLATIATAGKVNNSATTATAANTGSAIIARDASGNFAGGTFTGEVNRDAKTTVTAGTYGSATAIPVLTIDANGFVDSAGTIGVSGITGVTYDSSNGNLTIATSGDDFVDNINLSPFTTANLAENTNLYYTNARARASIAGRNGLAYNASTGVMDIDSANVKGMFSGGTGITYSNGAISTTDGDIVHDNLSGFVANEHIDHSGVSVTAGTGLTGGGTIAATRTLNVIGGKGITANANDIQVDSANIKGMFSASGSLSYSNGAFSFTERTAAQILTALKTVDTNSSGLNADLLDGQQGTHYRINVYNNAGTLLN